MGRLFGTDGVRGVANVDLTPELALALGRALVAVLKDDERRPSVVIGRDPRWSGEVLEAALVAGITSAGGDAVTVGVLPTPGVAFITPATGAAAGAVISASHNPVGDNGIKFFNHEGFKLTDEQEDRLEGLLGRDDLPRPRGIDIGRRYSDHGAVARYVSHLTGAAETDLSGLRIVVDGANGAASSIGPQVYRQLRADVVTINCAPDGANINREAGSTHPEVLQAAVQDSGADVGVAHDGDADRVIAVTGDGALVDGDVILAILARHRKESGALREDTVVTTVMTNLGFKKAMRELDVEVLETAVGDRYVLEAMRERRLVLGGEQSGHIIQLDEATTGDGLLSAVKLLSVVKHSGQDLDGLSQVMTRLPQVLVNIAVSDRGALEDADDVWAAVAAEEGKLGEDGRVLVRPSGTEPLVRVMVEAPTDEDAQASADRIAAVVREVLNPA
ncbi:MAG: phosphoglucosamine mutase [Actinobacteria bacterium]|nr:phosphoglucosamine mutase [Actinomycetota bacterium]